MATFVTSTTARIGGQGASASNHQPVNSSTSTKKKRSWDDNFKALILYKKECGHCRVPTQFEPDPMLGRWVANERSNCHQGKLSKQKRKKLEAIGFDFPKVNKRSTWTEMMGLMKAWKCLHGDCRVPSRATFDGHNLGEWVSRQRKKYKKGSLDAKHKRQLVAISFIWDAKRADPYAEELEVSSGAERPVANKRAKTTLRVAAENMEKEPTQDQLPPPPQTQLFSWFDSTIPIMRFTGKQVTYHPHPLDNFTI